MAWNKEEIGLVTKITKQSNFKELIMVGGHDLGDTHRLGFELKF